MITLWCTWSFSYLMMAEALWFTSQGVWQFVQPPPRVMSVGPWRLIPEMPNNLTVFQHIFQLKKINSVFQHLVYVFLKNTWSYGASWYLKLGSSEMENDELAMCHGVSQLSAPRRIWGNERNVDERRPQEKPMLMQCNGGLHDLILDHICSICFQKHVNRICLIIAFLGEENSCEHQFQESEHTCWGMFGQLPARSKWTTSGCHRVWLMTFRKRGTTLGNEPLNRYLPLFLSRSWQEQFSSLTCKSLKQNNMFYLQISQINQQRSASTEAPNSTTFSMWRCRKGGSVSQRCVHKTARHYKFLMIDECGTWISLSSERLVTMTARVILHNIL